MVAVSCPSTLKLWCRVRVTLTVAPAVEGTSPGSGWSRRPAVWHDHTGEGARAGGPAGIARLVHGEAQLERLDGVDGADFGRHSLDDGVHEVLRRPFEAGSPIGVHVGEAGRGLLALFSLVEDHGGKIEHLAGAAGHPQESLVPLDLEELV